MLTAQLHKDLVSHGKGPWKEAKGREDEPEIAIHPNMIHREKTAKKKRSLSS
jgi:hypothetical protein